MKRALAVLIVGLFLLAACAAPAATPAPQAPAQKPAEPKPAEVRPTQVPVAPAQPAPATRAPLATAQPEFKPPQSGGVLNPPTMVPTPRNNPANVDTAAKKWIKHEIEVPPPARYDHAFAFFFEVYTMMAYGGRAENTLGDTWTYTPGKGWFQSAPRATPPPRFGAVATYYSYHSNTLMFGGQSGVRFFNDVWEYKDPPDEWVPMSTTGDAPTPRAGASIGIETDFVRKPYSNLLIVTHGHSDREYFDDTFVLDLTTRAWREISPANRPPKRKGQAGTFDARQGKIFLFGGQDVAGNLLGDLWELDPAKRTWTKITPSGAQPSPRSNATLTYDYNGRLWLFGGETGSGATNELWMYDIASKQWSLTDSSNKPSARSRHEFACAHDGEICYIFGGMDANGKALNDLWQFTP